jgi:hypothetical protein
VAYRKPVGPHSLDPRPEDFNPDSLVPFWAAWISIRTAGVPRRLGHDAEAPELVVSLRSDVQLDGELMP